VFTKTDPQFVTNRQTDGQMRGQREGYDIRRARMASRVKKLPGILFSLSQTAETEKKYKDKEIKNRTELVGGIPIRS